MAFENKTITQIETLIIDGLETKLNTKFRLLPKAFVRILAKVLAGVYITLYKQQGWMFLQLFVDYATFDSVYVLGRVIRPLVEWGRLIGVGDPRDPLPWKGSVTVKTVAVKTYLYAGIQLKSSITGQIYITAETKLLVNPEEKIKIQCTVSGTVGNIDVNSELQFVNPFANVETKAVTSEVEAKGEDVESEKTYRHRVKQRWQVQVQGGALADYRNWASEVEGVYNTYIYSDTKSAAGVLIYVAADPNITSSRQVPGSVLIKVGEACTYDPVTKHPSRKPIGAVLDPAFNGTYSNVKNVTVINFDVYVEDFAGGDVEDFKKQVRSNLDLYFYQKEPFIKGLSFDDTGSDLIRVNNLISVVDDITSSMKATFSTVSLKKDGNFIKEYKLVSGEVANLGKLYINGESK